MSVMSVSYSERIVLGHDSNRRELMVFEEAGETTIKLGATENIGVPVTGYFETVQVPIGEVIIETTGSFILLAEASVHVDAGTVIEPPSGWYDSSTFQIQENKQIPEGEQINELI